MLRLELQDIRVFIEGLHDCPMGGLRASHIKERDEAFAVFGFFERPYPEAETHDLFSQYVDLLVSGRGDDPIDHLLRLPVDHDLDLR